MTRDTAETPSARRWLPAAAVGAVVATLATLMAWPAAEALTPATEVGVAAVLPVAGPGPSVGAEPALPRTVRSVQAAGWIEPAPYHTTVAALTDGVVASVAVLGGEPVAAGQVVAELVADDAALSLRSAEAALASAEAQRVAAAAEAAAGATRWDAATELTRAAAVAAAGRDAAASAVAAHPERVREAEAERDRWREELELQEAAARRGAANPREVAIAAAELRVREANAAALRAETAGVAARLEAAEAERRAAAEALTLRVEDRLARDAAAAGLAAADAAVSAAEAAVAEARLRLERTTLRSPITGVVMARLKAPGDVVVRSMDDPHATHVLHLYDPASLQVRVDVPLADAAEVSAGQACEVVVDVAPDAVFRGEVSRVTHRADLQKNTLEVKVRVVDPSPLLRPEMLARVRFLGGSGGSGGGRGAAGGAADAAVRVPVACLDGDRVWAVRGREGARGSARPVPVTVGQTADGFAAVVGALRVGDLLVLDPAGHGLAPAAPLAIRAAAGAGGAP